MRKTKSPADPFERILATLHEAAFNEAGWTRADRLIGGIIGTSGSALGLYGGTSSTDGTTFLMHLCVDGQRRTDWERRYTEEYAAEDERIPRIVQQRYGRITHTGDLYTDAEKKTSPTYNEVMVSTKSQNGLNIRMEGPDGLFVVWNVSDPIEPGGWRSDQIRLIRRLRPHVRQFALVHHAVAEARVTGAATMGLLANSRFGVIHLDRQGRIMTANDRALQTLRESDGLTDQDGFLLARMPAENAELSRLLARALPLYRARGSAGSMTVTRSSSPARRLALHITPVGDDYPNFRTRRLGAVVLVVDPTSPARLDPVHVAAALDLTSMESELVVGLAAGRTVKDIARAVERAENTVRWHLKQVYRKQGISRQVDLVRRVLSLEGFGAIPRDPWQTP